MQSFKEINGQDNIKNSRTTINDSIKTVMSNNSGTAFPTTNLQVGMKCYRTDLGKTYTLTDVANKTWKEDNHATLADSANKLSGLTVAGSNDSQAITNKIPKIDGSGVMEVGKYIDFHSTNKQTTDYTARITANDDGTISVSGGINATLKGNASSASSVPWTGVTGKPSTYPPSGHNHDSAYPARDGSRAYGKWNISITGEAYRADVVNNVYWKDLIGKPSAYPPSAHHHDIEYPSITGLRASGTWNIDIKGTASKAKYASDSDMLDGYHYKDIVSKVMQQVSLNSGISKLALTPNGYVVFGNGLTIMWGEHQNPVVFPISFKTTCLQVVPQLQALDGSNMSKNRVYVTNLTVSGFSLDNPQSTYRYIAIGY